MGEDRLDRDLSVGVRLDHQHRALLPFGVEHADHRRHLHTGTGRRDVLDIDGADPFAAGLDHVLAAVGNAHEAIGIQRGDVTGVEPAILIQRAFFAAVVALDRPGAAHLEAAGADAIARQLTSFLVDDLEFDTELQASLTRPDCVIGGLLATLGQLWRRRRHHAQRAGLGHAPQLTDRDAVLGLEGLGHGPRNGGTADHQTRQAAGVLTATFQMGEVHGPDGRHAAGQGHALGLNQFLQARAVHLVARQYELAAIDCSGKWDAPGGAVIERRARHDAIEGGQAERAGQAGGHRMQHHRAVAVEHTLGVASGAGGVTEHRAGVLVELRPVQRLLVGDQLLVAQDIL